MNLPRLASERCLYHPAREAVARCPECGSFYCRECIAEHEDRIICATCLQRLLRPAAEKPRPVRRAAGWLAGSLAGLLLAWFSFYSFGRLLLTMPSAFHAAALWGEQAFPASETPEP